MRLAFHPSVAADIARIMAHYEQVGGERLAEEFYAELRRFFLKAKSAPEHYAIRARDLRRVNPRQISIPFPVSHRRRPCESAGCAPSRPAPVIGDFAALTRAR